MIAQLDDDQKLILAKTIWMTAFEAALKACIEDGLRPEITFAAMVEVMTEMMKYLLRKEDQ